MQFSAGEYDTKHRFIKTSTSAFERFPTTNRQKCSTSHMGTPSSHKLKLNTLKNLPFRSSYYKDSGYQKGEFFANLLSHLEFNPLQATNAIKTPHLRMDISQLQSRHYKNSQRGRLKYTSALASRRVSLGPEHRISTQRANFSQSVARAKRFSAF